ncbi:unnamed protein product [Heligmosomoides polygyrus]|uniref:Uncharacterized protein n=1 Tax=Heligmosomoides polygyrus TaxID=6339 RepID=A0A183FXH5_HELPZ|nr:unnamed protein product [Heligmosomoides polygyrus]
MYHQEDPLQQYVRLATYTRCLTPGSSKAANPHNYHEQEKSNIDPGANGDHLNDTTTQRERSMENHEALAHLGERCRRQAQNIT